ncbi:hypothetical protein SAMD00019534_038280, partial [Acytostelium subglobosum LB1]|uniref:hypothetical protein n=1 Tax=Acytostelium subglobosum LB1 TaxID=1410327 RepID=UPI000644FD85
RYNTIQTNMLVPSRLINVGLRQVLNNSSKNVAAATTTLFTSPSANNININNNVNDKRTFFTVLNQYEAGVTFTLGRMTSVKKAGIRMLIPFLQEMEVVDLRTVSISLEKQEIITRDNISVIADAIVYYRVIDPEKAIVKVTNHDKTIQELSQIKIRETLSQNTLDEVLHNREKFGHEINESVREIAAEWGLLVERINLKDIKFEEGMSRAMAKKAEAERLREAKIIYAQSEVQTAHQILEAAKTLESSPLAIRLRELDTLQQIAKEPSKTLVFVPSNLFQNVPGLTSFVNSMDNNTQQIDSKTKS